MRLIVLGSNGTYPTAGRPASGYLLEENGTSIWMDAGSGTFQALQARMDPLALDAVILSHRHVDHCADVFALYHYLRFGPTPGARLPLMVPDGLADRLAAFVGGEAGLQEAFNVRSVGAGHEVTIGGLALRFGAADHPVPTLQVRVDAGGRSLAYSADTGPASELVKLAAGADVLLSEATYQGKDKGSPQHLTAFEAGEAATQAGVGRLILTHVLPTLDPEVSISEAAVAFAGHIDTARPGLEVEV